MCYCSLELTWGQGKNKYSSGRPGLYLVVFVKDALEKEVGGVVELCGGAWRDFQPTHKHVLFG